MASGEQTNERIDILLVEPNPGDSRLFEESFKDAKLANTFHTVTDGESALDYLHQRGDYATEPRPDLVLLEPQLPGKSGQEVLSELNNDSELRDIPVAVLTGSDVEEKIARTHGLDADHYIRKPIDSDEFIDFVRSVEEFWLAIIQPAPADD